MTCRGANPRDCMADEIKLLKSGVNTWRDKARAAEQDAARYRWLVKRNPLMVASIAYSEPGACKYSDVNEAVDAAMETVEKLAIGPEGAWTCSGCGQRNSGRATECGRCETPVTTDSASDGSACKHGKFALAERCVECEAELAAGQQTACSTCDGSGNIYLNDLIWNCPRCNAGSASKL